jgi:hypothetical protein
MIDDQILLVLGIILATLAAIVYSLRILVLMERRIARIDAHIESLVQSVLKEEHKIEREENEIVAQLKKRK